jgi:hypothetical protein
MEPSRTDMDITPPDIVLLGPEWLERALLRAQLIEEGDDVIGIGPEHWKIFSIIVPSCLSRGDGSLLAPGQTRSRRRKMRKQDRIAASQQQSRPQQQPEKKPQPEPREREQVKGSASTNQPPGPQRQPGKLPLPD